jgi:hypothetical protein
MEYMHKQGMSIAEHFEGDFGDICMRKYLRYFDVDI